MLTSRRFFIGGAASGLGALASGCASRLFCAGCGSPRIRFGVVSDIHIQSENPTPHAAGTETFVQALEWFRDNGADAVLICGDLANRGVIDDLRPIGAAWDKVFPGDVAPDGRRVEKVFVYGNHDWEGFQYGYKYKGAPVKEASASFIRTLGMKKCWEEVFHEEYSPIYMKNIKGFSFIGSHWDMSDANGIGKTWVSDRIGEFLAARGKEIDPSLPFFYLQHQHPKNTCYGPWAWGHDNGKSTKALSAFPNAVAFSGHSHYPLTDERSIWQGAFISVGAGSLRYPGFTYDSHAPEGYQNTGASYGKRRAEFDGAKFMKNIKETWPRYGMLVSVYPDRMVFARREMSKGIPLGDDWVVPLPAAESKPFAYAERAKKFSAPQFPAGAVLKVAKIKGRRRDKQEGECFKLEFPAALNSRNARVQEYEISAKGASGEAVTKWIAAPGCTVPDGCAETLKPVEARIPAEGVQDGAVFSVTPVSCFGLRGRAISSAVCAGGGEA